MSYFDHQAAKVDDGIKVINGATFPGNRVLFETIGQFGHEHKRHINALYFFEGGDDFACGKVFEMKAVPF